MTAIQNQELVDIFKRVKDWPLDMRITLARRILETVETPPIAEPPRTLSLDQVIGILKTDAPPPTEVEATGASRLTKRASWMRWRGAYA